MGEYCEALKEIPALGSGLGVVLQCFLKKDEIHVLHYDWLYRVYWRDGDGDNQHRGADMGGNQPGPVHSAKPRLHLCKAAPLSA